MKRLKENLTNILLIIVIIVCSVCICNKIESAKNSIIIRIESVIENKSSYEQVKNVHEDLSNKIDVLQATIEGYGGHILSIEESAK